MMRGTRSAAFLGLILLLAVLGGLAGWDAARRDRGAEARFAANRALARWAGFTDPCLVTDARYTRHPSLADRHSPFQDYPLALEHFPSGALIPPPGHLDPGRSADGPPSPGRGGRR